MAQSKCSGLLVFQAAAQQEGTGDYTYGATCYGVTHSVGSSAVDLQQHHETRELSMEYKNSQVYSLHCLGSSIYSSVSELLVSAVAPMPRCVSEVHLGSWWTF